MGQGTGSFLEEEKMKSEGFSCVHSCPGSVSGLTWTEMPQRVCLSLDSFTMMAGTMPDGLLAYQTEARACLRQEAYISENVRAIQGWLSGLTDRPPRAIQSLTPGGVVSDRREL